MKATLLALFSLAIPGLAAAAPTDGEARFVARLYGALAKDPGNLVLSPASVRLALSMAAAGARGETAAQMRSTLELPAGDAADEAARAQLSRWEALARPAIPEAHANEDPSMQRYREEALQRRTTKLRVVNRLWTQRQGKLRADYLQRLEYAFHASAAPLDFATAPDPSRATINRWVSDATEKKIPQLLGPRTITKDTRAVLTNAVYLKASWQTPFEPQATREEPFFLDKARSVKTRLMHQVSHFSIARFDGGQLLELPYGDDKLAMDVILPDAKDGLSAVEQQLSAGKLGGWLAGLRGERVEVTLPRFKIGGSFDLADVMKKLGMALAFTFPGADFSGIDDSRLLYLSVVVHQAVIDVDEHGTEAAAATAVGMAAGGMPSRPTTFRADHPFLFLIRDRETNAVLFLGRLANPSAS